MGVFLFRTRAGSELWQHASRQESRVKNILTTSFHTGLMVATPATFPCRITISQDNASRQFVDCSTARMTCAPSLEAST